jgi:hypothetical protein
MNIMRALIDWEEMMSCASLSFNHFLLSELSMIRPLEPSEQLRFSLSYSHKNDLLPHTTLENDEDKNWDG